MCIANVIIGMPRWYLLVLIMFSLYYAIRGIMEKRIILSEQKYANWSFTQRVIIEYAQEFLFKVIFTASGFVALLVANHILTSQESATEMSAGISVILIFLFIWGISGISGYLPYLIIRGRFPGAK